MPRPGVFLLNTDAAGTLQNGMSRVLNRGKTFVLPPCAPGCDVGGLWMWAFTKARHRGCAHGCLVKFLFLCTHFKTRSNKGFSSFRKVNRSNVAENVGVARILRVLEVRIFRETSCRCNSSGLYRQLRYRTQNTFGLIFRYVPRKPLVCERVRCWRCGSSRPLKLRVTAYWSKAY